MKKLQPLFTWNGFQKNLKMIDGDMPEILAFLVADSFFNGKTRMRDLVKNLNDRDPLGVSPSIEYPYYEKKIKDMLVAMTLSMTAIETWGGEEGTNGGMIIVKENGDVVCYHIFDRNDFRDFLFKNTKFERPDNSRYFSMGIVDYGGKHLIPLNVQIRMDHSKTTREKTDIRGYYDFEKGEYIEKESSNIERWIQ